MVFYILAEKRRRDMRNLMDDEDDQPVEKVDQEHWRQFHKNQALQLRKTAKATADPSARRECYYAACLHAAVSQNRSGFTKDGKQKPAGGNNY